MVKYVRVSLWVDGELIYSRRVMTEHEANHQLSQSQPTLIHRYNWLVQDY